MGQVHQYTLDKVVIRQGNHIKTQSTKESAQDRTEETNTLGHERLNRYIKAH